MTEAEPDGRAADDLDGDVATGESDRRVRSSCVAFASSIGRGSGGDDVAALSTGSSNLFVRPMLIASGAIQDVGVTRVQRGTTHEHPPPDASRPPRL